MKIITWNIYMHTKEPKAAIKYIMDFDADIVCLQEVPEHSLEFLKYEGYNFHYAKDCTSINFFSRKSGFMSYLVIAVKKTCLAKASKMRFRNTSHTWWNRIIGFAENLEFLQVDFEHKKKKLRLFNIHLPFAASPTRRKKKFMKIFKRLHPTSNIICGDFNNFGRPFSNWFLGWLFNYNFSDYLENEKISFKKLFKKKGLNNVFTGLKTFMLGLQLDHILIPKHFKVKSKKVLSSGAKFSDHYPLFLELDI